MSAPRCSVLLPARNAAATLSRAVRSILAQTVRELELVLVDDGSSDGTGELARRLAAEDPRVRCVAGPGRGLSAALRVGLSHCRAQLIVRMDADDEALPERLARSLDALAAEPQLAAVGTQVELFRDDQPVSPNMRAYGAWLSSLTTWERLHRDRYVESPLCHPSVALRRAALEAVGGWEDGDFPEDYQLWLKLLAAGHRLRAIEPVLLRWRDGPARLTRTDGRYSPRRQLWLKAEFLARELKAGGARCAIWGAGELGLPLMRELRSRGVEVTALLDVNPRKVGQRVDGVEVRPVEWLRGPGEVHVVAAVGAKGAREEIRAHLAARGWREGPDFTCAA
jgi:glycosyltransferase involved in cell wall biosynthesis